MPISRSTGRSQEIGWAPDAQPGSGQHVGVRQGGHDVPVTEQFLNGADVVAGFEVGRQGVPESVAGGPPGNAGPAHGHPRSVRKSCPARALVGAFQAVSWFGQTTVTHLRKGAPPPLAAGKPARPVSGKS